MQTSIGIEATVGGAPSVATVVDPVAKRLNAAPLALWTFTASAAMLAAYEWPGAGMLALVCLFALVQIAHAPKWRLAFYPGLIAGLLIGIGRLDFFWRIFSGGAIALWLVFAIWIALFTALARLCLRRWPGWVGWIFLPFIWMGLEYFRSELYYLRFSWLSPGYALEPWQMPFGVLGTYGVGFLLMSLACLAALAWKRWKWFGAAMLVCGMAVIWVAPKLTSATNPMGGTMVKLAGAQMEFPSEPEVLAKLDELAGKYPEAQLLVMSEYTFLEGVPAKVHEWCAKNRRHLIVGGKEPAPGGNFFNTAYVLDPSGEIVFQQVKSVPIQFFKDGLPAPEQNVWASPWGRIGICICYDLSYTRVADRLIRQGAQALIVPTMDVADWGKRQHELHARIAPIRAAEYGVPIFRLASSGISQAVDRFGRLEARAAFPGQGETMAAELRLGAAGHLPLDRWLAPFAVGFTALIIMLQSACYFRERRRMRRLQTAGELPLARQGSRSIMTPDPNQNTP